MEAKEKAIEMFKKYLEWISNSYYHDGTYSKDAEDKSKECAKIAVDEILNLDSGDSVDKDYWEQVKTEIETL